MPASKPGDRSEGFPLQLVSGLTLGRSVGRLPTPLTSLVGRERERAEVSALLRRRDVRLVTLTGPGGVGKTRLALRVAADLAADFPGAVGFVSLASATDPGFVLPTVARTLGIPAEDAREAIERIGVALRDRALLLVVDNVEHVRAAGPDLAALLGACPRLRLLATSQVRLRVSGEHLYAMQPLALPAVGGRPLPERLATIDAVRLFLERARAVKFDFALTDGNASAIAEICRRLDGIPLAIELAAARIDVLSPRALLARLESRLPVLTGGPQDAPPRLRTMRGAITWSYDLLVPDAQRLLAQLAVFVGGSSLDAVEWVAGDREGDAHPPRLILDRLAALTEQSLLQRVDQDDDEPRYAMLETVREFALERLAISGEAEDARRRHAGFYRAFVAEAEPELTGPQQQIWLDRLERDLANIRAALTWSIEATEAETALALAAGLFMFWLKRGHIAEGRVWLDRVLALAPDNPARLAALLAAAGLAGPHGDFARADALANESLALATALGDRSAIARSRHQLGTTALYSGRPVEAIDLLGRALDGYVEPADAPWKALTLTILGVAAHRRGNASEAVARLEAARALQAALGEDWSVALSLNYLAAIASTAGEHGRAIGLYGESLERALRLGDAWIVADALVGLAGTLAEANRLDDAAMLFGGAEAAREAIGNALAHLPDHARYERQRAAVRRQLGADAFAAAWARGRDTPPAELLNVGRVLTEAEPDHASGARRGAAALAPGPALTAREREVLQLVVEGRTDREIGQILFIGHRTVASHVGNILGKLGVDSRTAAATQAVRRGLV